MGEVLLIGSKVAGRSGEAPLCGEEVGEIPLFTEPLLTEVGDGFFVSEARRVGEISTTSALASIAPASSRTRDPA